MTTTKLYEVLPGREKRLMNTITSGSRFQSIPWTSTANMGKPENQLRAARELADSWRTNGNKPEARYEIEQHGEVVK